MRARIINGQWKSVVKSILRGENSKVLAKKIFAIDSIKKDLCLLVSKLAATETKDICRPSRRSVLRQVSGKELCSFDVKDFIEELKSKCSVLHGLLGSIMGESTLLRQAVAAGVIIFARNNHMSRIHHVVGQVLDQGGATDEVIERII